MCSLQFLHAEKETGVGTPKKNELRLWPEVHGFPEKTSSISYKHSEKSVSIQLTHL